MGWLIGLVGWLVGSAGGLVLQVGGWVGELGSVDVTCVVSLFVFFAALCFSRLKNVLRHAS